MEMNAIPAFELPERLFPGVDFDTAEGRFYEAQNNIAIAVSEYRYVHKMTQTALAEKLGVSQAMIAKYESGSYNISLKAAFELFDKLGLRFSCKIEDEAALTNSVNESFASFAPIEESADDEEYQLSSPDLLIA